MASVREIFLYAKEKRIPLVGLNVSRKIIHKVPRTGLPRSGGLSELPQGLGRDIDQVRGVQGGDGEHAMEDSSFKNFCEAQMVWDAGMQEGGRVP